MKFSTFIITLLILGLLLPSFSFAQDVVQPPETMEEAKEVGLGILSRLPEAVKDVWQNQFWPIWSNMWNWVKDTWQESIGPRVGIWWQKLLDFLGKEPVDVKEEFQKEKTEMQKDTWERFKDLFK